jgi:hypothetical protein
MERLEEGRKVNGKKSFPLFGTMSERKERRIIVDPMQKTFPSNYERKVGIDDVIQ